MLSSFQSSSVLSSSRQRQQPRRTASVVVRCSADAERQKTGKAATVISATVGGVVLLPQAANAASKQTASVQAKAPPAKPEAKLVALPENVAQFLVFSQTIALVGAFVTGTRARQKCAIAPLLCVSLVCLQCLGTTLIEGDQHLRPTERHLFIISALRRLELKAAVEKCAPS